MTSKALHRADEIALHIELDKLGGEGAIDVISFFVDGDTLDMTAVEDACVNGKGEGVVHIFLPFIFVFYICINFFLFERKKERVLFLCKTRKVPKEICKRSA
jgi:hypothetical protein